MRLRSVVPEVLHDAVAKIVVESVIKKRMLGITQPDQSGCRGQKRFRRIHGGVKQVAFEIAKQDFKTVVPVHVAVALRFVPELFDRAQQLALNGFGLTGFRDILLPDLFGLVEKFHDASYLRFFS